MGMNLFEEIKQNFLFSKNGVRRIIAVNVAIFLVVEVFSVISGLMKLHFSLNVLTSYLTLPSSLSSYIYRPWSIYTYMFIHEGILHIFLNMIWLNWMGNILYEYLGNKRLYQSYFLGGIFGGVFFILAYNIFPAFQDIKHQAYALGASAGVLSVSVAAATLIPEAEVSLFGIFPIRLKWLALIIIVIDFLSIVKGNAGGHIAHLGGSLFGFLFIKYLYTNTVFDKFFNKIGNLFSKKSKLKVHYKTTQNGNSVNIKVSQQEVDLILDKISKSGYESLSKREKEILFKASKD